MSINNISSISGMTSFVKELEHKYVEIGKYGNREVVQGKGRKNEERISVDQLAKKTLALLSKEPEKREEAKAIAEGLRSLNERVIIEPVDKQSVKSMVGATAKVIMNLFKQEVFLRHLGKLEDQVGIKGEEKTAPQLAKNMVNSSAKVQTLAKELEGIGAKMKGGKKLDSLEKWQGRITSDKKYMESSPRHVWQPILSMLKEKWYRRKAGKVLEDIAKEKSLMPKVEVLSDWKKSSVEMSSEKKPTHVESKGKEQESFRAESAKVKSGEIMSAKVEKAPIEPFRFEGTAADLRKKWDAEGLKEGTLTITNPNQSKTEKIVNENMEILAWMDQMDQVMDPVLESIKKNSYFTITVRMEEGEEVKIEMVYGFGNVENKIEDLERVKDVDIEVKYGSKGASGNIPLDGASGWDAIEAMEAFMKESVQVDVEVKPA